MGEALYENLWGYLDKDINILFARKNWVSREKPIWILMRQEMRSAGGIS